MMSAEARKSLATQLNKMIDIPMVGEEQEQVIAEKVIDACLGSIDTAAVAPSSEQLQEANGNPEKQTELQSSMVKKLNGMIDIPFANEEQEAMVLSMIVEYFVKDKMKTEGGAVAEDGSGSGGVS